MEASAAHAAARAPRNLRFASAKLLRLASDERLVEHVRTGSEAAFEVVYDRHHRGILAFCRHMLGSREEAEDAVQHTFMAAYRALVDSPPREMSLRAWLYAIARNRCLSVLRARRDRPTEDLDEAATEGLGAEVQRRADLRDLLADLAELPEDQRAALVLSELGDMSHGEIGAVVGCPREKVKALVFQARTSLQHSREAREMPCADVREMLAALSGGALRRAALRRHVRGCPGCREFEAEVKRQRRAMAMVLPVVPTLALKESALAAAFGAKSAAAGGAAAAGVAGATAGGVATAGGMSALTAKVLVVAAVASGGAVAGHQAVGKSAEGGAATAPAKAPGGAPVAPLEEATDEREAAPVRPARDENASKGGGSDESRRRGHRDRGKAWAETRGDGRKRGLRGTQPGRSAEKMAEREKRIRPKAKQRAERPTERKPPRRAAAPHSPARPAPRPKPAPAPRPAPQAKPKKPAPAPAPAVAPTATPQPVAEPTPAAGGKSGSAARSPGR